MCGVCVESAPALGSFLCMSVILFKDQLGKTCIQRLFVIDMETLKNIY